MRIREELLQYIWQFKKFQFLNLHTVKGDKVQIVDAGFWNIHSGPDFINSKIKINDTLWCGNIEIHCFSSDWNLHNHQNDIVYNNVILHVVYEVDKVVFRQNSTEIPTLELKHIIDYQVISQYQNVFHALSPFSCSANLNSVDELIIHSQIERSAVNRIILKSDYFLKQLEINKGDWEQTTYHQLFRNFGFHLNGLPFEMLAFSLPFKIIKSLKGNLHYIEALLFGQSGLLNNVSNENYVKQLNFSFKFLSKKYKLKPIGADVWKFLRTRPSNFPTLRIAQLAAFLNQNNQLFDSFLNFKSKDELLNLFNNLNVSLYWETHYHFNKTGNLHSAKIGIQAVVSILINTVSTLLFAYGSYLNRSDLKNKAIHLLEGLPPEQNAIVNLYRNYGVPITNAFQSQGILHLSQHYCAPKKCLQCRVGLKLMS